MKRSFVRSPYLWAIVGVVAVVTVAWVGRESYRPVITGSIAPDFTVFALDGSEVNLSDYSGDKVVLVNVWATWCPPCVVEMPAMQRLYESLDELGLTFPILHNPSGDIQLLYQTTGVPESFVIGKDGLIYKKVAGPTEWDATVNEELIRRLLAN